MYEMIVALGVAAALGFALGHYTGLQAGRSRMAIEMVQTYKHLLDYGRTREPKTEVTESPGSVEGIAEVRISERSIGAVEQWLKSEGIGGRRAREHAEELVSQYESFGQVP